MTRLLLVFVLTAKTEDKAVLLQLKELASMSSCIVRVPLELEDPVPSTDAARLARVAEILERAARGARVREGMRRAKAEGRRIGRPPALSSTIVARIVSARASGASWGVIGHMYGIPRSSARRVYINDLESRPEHQASKREGGPS